MRIASLLCVLGVLAPAAIACDLQITAYARPDGQTYEVRWTEVAGATHYDVFERREGEEFHQIRTVPADGEVPRFVAKPSSTTASDYAYLIIAEGPDGTACVATTAFELPGDQQLGEATHKRIVPFAGSVHGANGSDFHTALTLHHFAFAKGTIYFRPIGTFPSESDPFLSYQFGDNGPGATSLHWDDINAALGVEGVGTIEIVPEPREDGLIFLPRIEAYVYNSSPDGTFGTRVPAVAPARWFRDEASETLWIPAVSGDYRRNAGFRTLTEVLYSVRVSRGGQNLHTTPFRKVKGNMTVFGSVDEIAGTSVPQDAEVFVTFLGEAIGFYTNTQNTTNDPALVIHDPEESLDVTWGY